METDCELIEFLSSPFLHARQVRHRFGLYDKIVSSADGRATVRNCNWVRFLRVNNIYSPQVSAVPCQLRTANLAIPCNACTNPFIYLYSALCWSSHKSTTQQVNVVCTKIKGEPIYEIVRNVPAHEELVVFYLLERIEDEILTRIQNTIYRQTMDSILEGQYSKLTEQGSYLRPLPLFALIYYYVIEVLVPVTGIKLTSTLCTGNQ